MKKLEMTLCFLLVSTSIVCAASDNPQTKMAASAIAAVVFFGIVAIIRSFKNKGKDN